MISGCHFNLCPDETLLNSEFKLSCGSATVCSVLGDLFKGATRAIVSYCVRTGPILHYRFVINVDVGASLAQSPKFLFAVILGLEILKLRRKQQFTKTWTLMIFFDSQGCVL